MLVWGGYSRNNPLADGSIYDLAFQPLEHDEKLFHAGSAQFANLSLGQELLLV